MTGMSVRVLEWLEGRGLDVELCDRMGLESRSGGSGDVLVYPAIRQGSRIGNKYRPLQHVEGQPRFWRDKGTPSIAFNEDALRDDSLIGEPLIITEGYEDAIVAIQSGWRRTISVPDGAPEKPVQDLESSDKYAWIDPLYGLLKLDRVREIILAVDGDEPGAALMHDLAIKLGKSRCKFVTYPKAKDQSKRDGRERLKDLNEVLEDYGEKGVKLVLSKATFIKVNGVYSMSQLPPMPDSRIYEIGFEALGEHFKLRLGDLSVWTGVPSHGKTTALNDIICRVVERYGVRAAWASFEQDPQRDHRRALRSWFCQEYEPKLTRDQRWAADEWIEDQFRFVVADDDEDPTLEWLLEKMEVAAIQHDCRIIVIDPWNEATHERAHGESETDYTNRSLRTLKKFAKRFQVHVAVVAHPTKLQRKDDGTYPIPSLYDVSGSAAWYNKPDQGVIVHRLDADVTIIKVQKSRYHEILGSPGIVKMHYAKESRRFIEIERNVVELEPKRRRGHLPLGDD
jgi:twinkle protein